MSEYLPKELRAELVEARLARKLAASRVRVKTETGEVPVTRHWNGGFAVAAGDARALRGRVDLYDGPQHLCQALILTSREEGGERVFEFKYATRPANHAPLADFVREADAPTALLPRPGRR